MDAVSGQGPQFKHAQVFHQGNGGLAVLLQAVVHFSLGFGQMHMDFCTQAAGPFHHRFDEIRAAGIGGVGAKHYPNPVIAGAVPLFVQLRVFVQPGFTVRHRGAGKSPG